MASRKATQVGGEPASLPAVVPCPARWSRFIAKVRLQACDEAGKRVDAASSCAAMSLIHVVCQLPEAAGRVCDEHFASLVGARARLSQQAKLGETVLASRSGSGGAP